MRRLIRGLLMVVVITLISLGLLELLLRLIAPNLNSQIGVIARTITTGSPYSETWTPAWRENRDHYYTLRPNLTDVVQYGSPSVVFKLTTHKLWDDGLLADEGIGFRNRPVDYGVDMVVTGDSFGFCFTEQTDCWVDQLAAKHQLGAVNLAVPVTGSLSHAKMLTDFAAPLKPKLVIWQFFGNDFNDDYALLSWRGDIERLTGDVSGENNNTQAGNWFSQNLVSAAVLELLLTGNWAGLPGNDPAFVAQYQAVYPDRTPFLFGKPYELAALDMRREVNQFGIETTRQALADSKALVESWGGTLVVLIIPTREEVYRGITANFIDETTLDSLGTPRQTLLEICTDLSLTCYDPTDDLYQIAATSPALYYPDDMHLNAAGNTALTDLLSDWLRGLNLIPTETTS